MSSKISYTTLEDIFTVSGPDGDNPGFTVFKHMNYGSFRITAKDGFPWFLAHEVCRALDLDNVGQAISSLDDEEKSSITINDGTPGSPNRAIISESGLYSLALRSRKPEAKAFKRWITHDVIPSIRKHGGYLSSAKIEEALLDPDTLIRLATNLKEERTRRTALETKIAEDRPKVLFAEAVSVSDTTILVRELAKLIQQGTGVEIGEQRLFTWLRDNGFLIRQQGSSWNMPTQKSMKLGLFVIKEGTYQHPDKGPQITKTPKVTGKGQLYFLRKFGEGMDLTATA